MNYTKDQTEYMIEKYKTNPSRDTVEELADEFSKSVKSVIGKMRLESKLTIWLVSRRLRKLLLKQSSEYYLNKPCQGSQRGY